MPSAVSSSRSALGTNNIALQAQAIDEMIASGQVERRRPAVLYRNQGVLANNAGDKAKAEAAYAKWVELSPNDPKAMVAWPRPRPTSRSRPRRCSSSPARSSRSAPPASRSTELVQMCAEARLRRRANPALREVAQKLSRDLVAAYPTPENWRDALLIFRDTTSSTRPPTSICCG